MTNFDDTFVAAIAKAFNTPHRRTDETLAQFRARVLECARNPPVGREYVKGPSHMPVKEDSRGYEVHIPLSAFSDHQARQNHRQTLVHLAERGGLSAAEAVAILQFRDYEDMPLVEAVNTLEAILDELSA